LEVALIAIARKVAILDINKYESLTWIEIEQRLSKAGIAGDKQTVNMKKINAESIFVWLGVLADNF
jgi:hypothetical protein